MTIVTLPPRLPPRELSGHKGMYGRVLVVGGSEEMIGAPVLAGTAALRLGSGLVQIAMPKSVLATALSVTPEIIGLALDPRRKRALRQAAEKADAIVVGPGMGTGKSAQALLTQLVRLDKKMVVDADALNWLAGKRRWPGDFRADAVLTPHPGEMNRLAKLLGRDRTPSDEEGRIEIALSAARTFRQCIVLKGERTVVAERDGRVYVNNTGNSALSKAGSGDVLSGILGSLLGLGMERFDAACAAVCLHGLAGEKAGEKWGLRSALARDVIDAIPQAIAEYETR